MPIATATECSVRGRAPRRCRCLRVATNTSLAFEQLDESVKFGFSAALIAPAISRARDAGRPGVGSAPKTY